MKRSDNNQQNPDRPAVYQIRLQGKLGRQWADWFDNMSVQCEADGDTLITGPVADQAALYGLLRKCRDLGLPLLSVHCIDSDLPNRFAKFSKFGKSL